MKKLLYGIVCLMFLFSVEQNMEAKMRTSQFKEKGRRKNRLLKRERRALKDDEKRKAVAVAVRDIGTMYPVGYSDAVKDEDTLEELIDEIEMNYDTNLLDNDKDAFKKASKRARKRRKEKRQNIAKVEKFFDFQQDEFNTLK